MNVVNIIKCGICGAKTNIKVQLGYVNDFYISVPCLKCGSTINGKGHLEAPKYKFEFTFENITDCGRYDFDYYCECSPELIVKKTKFLIIKEESHMPIFFENTDFLGENATKESYKKVFDYINEINLKWEKNSNLINLYLNNNTKILHDIIISEQKEKYEKDIELCFYKHLLYRNTFDLFFVIPSHDLTKCSKTFEKEFLNLDFDQVNKVVTVMKKRNLFEVYDRKLYDLASKIINKIIYLTPSLTAQYFKKKIDYNIYGVSSCMPNDIVELYKDCYETLILFVPIIMMLNNIKYRQRYDLFKDSKKTVKKIFELSKGNLLKEINNQEFFDNLFYNKMEKTIRNSIGHNDYKYDYVNQKILFKDTNNKREIYLIEFMLEIIEMICCFVNIENMFYYLERAKFIIDGSKSDYLLTEYPRKIERNEKCLCGSGKKYKKCHYR